MEKNKKKKGKIGQQNNTQKTKEKHERWNPLTERWVISSAKNIENEYSKLVRTASKTNEIGEFVRGISNIL